MVALVDEVAGAGLVYGRDRAVQVGQAEDVVAEL